MDPDGKDIWELNEQGSLVNKIADKTQDAIRMNGKQISFEHNSISSVTQDDYQTTFSFGNMNKIYVIHYKKSYVNNRIIPFCSQILTTVPLDNLYKI